MTATVPAESFAYCKLLWTWVSANCAGIALPGCVVLDLQNSVMTVVLVDCSEEAWFYLVLNLI